MDFIADLHIHSRYSRATSREGDLPHLAAAATQKGITLLGTGDFTHPAWRKEMAENLIPAEEGLYRLKEDPHPPERAPRFVLSGEISCIYKSMGKTRKVHLLILLPSLEAAETLSKRLEAIGNIRSDGRPILGLDSRDLLEITLEACPDAIFIPAHIWTPHFSLFGAFSDFSSPEECFRDLTPYIHAMETGLSSDPPMNWRCSTLDRFVLISNSDAHSPAKLGREANLLSCDLSYPALRRALETGEGFAGTLEFFPEEGKYHLDGHRNCHLRLTPSETRAFGGKCPICGKKITVGVLHRVEELSDRPEGFRPNSAKPFEHLMPLSEAVASCLGLSSASGKVQALTQNLLNRLGPEFEILRTVPLEDIRAVGGTILAEGLSRLRQGRVQTLGGFDGEYGVISLFSESERREFQGQLSFFPAPAADRDAHPADLKTESLPASASGTDAIPSPDSCGEVAATTAPPLFNPEQRQAIHSSAPVIAVIAGPGTGKTRTLVERIAALLEQGVSPAEITAVTFTRQAAREMKERLSVRLKRGLPHLTIGTFHAICLDLLAKAGHTPSLLDPSEAAELARQILIQEGADLSPQKLLQAVSARKNGVGTSLPDALFKAYDACLKGQNLMDFDDLLREGLLLKPGRNFRHLLVDEFQDINGPQLDLLFHWAEESNSLFVIGDPDQSVYGFRGADSHCFEKLRERFPQAEIIRLCRNYRSSPQILACASAALGSAPTLCSTHPDGPAVRLVRAGTPFEEGVFVAKEINRMTGGLDMLDAQRAQDRPARAFSEIALLCRTHRQLDLLEKCLIHESIPCTVCGRQPFLEDPKVRGTLGFFRSLTQEDPFELRICLREIFSCPPDLIDTAVSIFGTVRSLLDQTESGQLSAALSKAGLDEVVRDRPPLDAWIQAYAVFAPRCRREKPRKLLESFLDAHRLSSEPLTRLLEASVFSEHMEDFLADLLLGEEGDLKRSQKKNYPSGAVRLMTLHAAKGLEFPVVFLCGLSKGLMPLESAGQTTNPDEEARLFYVGLTRACQELILSAPEEESPFLSALAGLVTTEQAARRPVQGIQLSLF